MAEIILPTNSCDMKQLPVRSGLGFEKSRRVCDLTHAFTSVVLLNLVGLCQLIGATAHGAEDGEEGTRLADNIVPPTPTTVCMKRSPLAYSPHPIRASREENNPSTLIRGDNNLLDQWVGCHARMRWGEAAVLEGRGIHEGEGGIGEVSYFKTPTVFST
ncbi:unnamed protein product [Mesocestoides corti]|uniref:Uncharacterized protein n=1 Tax=Mesocestoides corti TaxID=53468 RepID=A0A0R3UEQ4_MESCO|nr:unnamed protein product [Mesocestoides corti]